MKKVLILLVLLVGFSYLGALIVPYHFYKLALNDGISSKYLNLKSMQPQYYKAHPYKILRTKEISAGSSSEWSNLHFGEFIVPFPMEHPQFIIVPYFEKFGDEHLFGYRLVDHRYRDIVKVVFLAPLEYKLELHHHRLFQMPLFKNYILEKELDKVWRDMFERDLSQSSYLNGLWSRPFPDNLNIMATPIKEMVYDLFILSMRERLLPSELEKISYWEELDRGLLEVTDDESRAGRGKSFSQEILMVRKDNLVHPILIRTKLETVEAQAYRERFLRTLELKKSMKHSSVAIYSEYKKLDYSAKMEQGGMALLYAALSHEKGSRAFLREMIQFLERDKSDKVILDSLYDYAYALFGSSFSTTNNLKETAQEKLQRGIEEEEKAEAEQMRRLQIADESEQFGSSDEKVRRYLRKAKDKRHKKDSKMPKTMIVD